MCSGVKFSGFSLSPSPPSPILPLWMRKSNPAVLVLLIRVCALRYFSESGLPKHDLTARQGHRGISTCLSLSLKLVICYMMKLCRRYWRESRTIMRILETRRLAFARAHHYAFFPKQIFLRLDIHSLSHHAAVRDPSVPPGPPLPFSSLPCPSRPVNCGTGTLNRISIVCEQREERGGERGEVDGSAVNEDST